MLARVLAPAQLGLTSRIIEVECDISNGLPAFLVVGLADKAVDEAKERVRSALRHAKLLVPPKRITLNLAPADLPKDGTGFDLSMAIALLLATGQLKVDVSSKLFVGELGLDGALRPIRGALSHAQAAAEHELAELYVPAANAAEAALVNHGSVYAITSLEQLYRHLLDEQPLTPFSAPRPLLKARPAVDVDFAIIQGQAQAKRALEVAAAGGHNVLLSGPPGSGKTMLARAVAGVLPPLSLGELIEVNQIHSIAGLTADALVTTRPFRNPHHTASSIALIGGGRFPRPGEISLSHRGVLFLDELPEFPRHVLEVLRQPIEDGRVSIARAQGSITYPARCMLIATQNPCPCGFASDEARDCSCTPSQINRYIRKLSGPLLDRIDITIEVGRVKSSELTTTTTSETSQAIAERIQEARQRQHQRLGGDGCNATMTSQQLRQHCVLDEATTALAEQAIGSLQLSARGYLRVLRVARTIADLEDSKTIGQHHLTEALQYRARA